MSLADTLKSLSPDEARAVLQALDQYVENGHCNMEVDDPHESDPLLAHAETALDRLNSYFTALAEAS